VTILNNSFVFAYNEMISIDNKLFEEIDKPVASKITSEDRVKGMLERESSWTGQITGFNFFPNGTAQGQGNSSIFRNGISISNWQGIITTENGQEYLLWVKM
jgi:hypothetical protein